MIHEKIERSKTQHSDVTRDIQQMHEHNGTNTNKTNETFTTKRTHTHSQRHTPTKLKETEERVKTDTFIRSTKKNKKNAIQTHKHTKRHTDMHTPCSIARDDHGYRYQQQVSTERTSTRRTHAQRHKIHRLLQQTQRHRGLFFVAYDRMFNAQK